MATKDKPHFLVIGHGGTIGMAPGPDGSLRPALGAEEILDRVPGVSDLASFELHQVTDKDSTNVNPSDWTRLGYVYADALDSNQFDGFITLHGTDTVSDTAAATGYMFGPEPPSNFNHVVAQKETGAYGTDAVVNVQEAVLASVKAWQMGIRESMVTAGHVVVRGTRALKRTEAGFDVIWSPCIPPIATIDALGVHFQPHARRFNKNSKYKNWRDDFKPTFARNTFTVTVEPGLEPGMVELIVDSGKCAGLIIRSLGAGNVPTEGEFSLIPVIDKAVNRRGIPVLISTKFPAGTAHQDVYETGKLAADVGAIGTGDLTEVAAHVKFMWALGQGITTTPALRKFMVTDYGGDVTGPVFNRSHARALRL